MLRLEDLKDSEIRKYHKDMEDRRRWERYLSEADWEQMLIDEAEAYYNDMMFAEYQASLVNA